MLTVCAYYHNFPTWYLKTVHKCKISYMLSVDTVNIVKSAVQTSCIYLQFCAYISVLYIYMYIQGLYVPLVHLNPANIYSQQHNPPQIVLWVLYPLPCCTARCKEACELQEDKEIQKFNAKTCISSGMQIIYKNYFTYVFLNLSGCCQSCLWLWNPVHDYRTLYMIIEPCTWLHNPVQLKGVDWKLRLC